MRINSTNFGVANRQNVTSKRKTGMNHATSFGMKMNNQPNKSYIRQNIDILSSNVINGKDYISINNIDLNKTKAISFGGIDEWKKLINKNPAIKSLAQLQGFAAAAGAFAGIVPNRHVCSGFTVGMINAINDKFCENYNDYSAKINLNKAMYAVPSIVAGIDELTKKLSTSNLKAIETTALLLLRQVVTL